MTSSYEDLIQITDFTPGIHQTRYESSVGGAARQGPIRPGAASVENTYRCVAHPDGSLGPAPRRVAAAPNLPVPGTQSAPSFYPTGMIERYISDAIVESGVFEDTSQDTLANIPFAVNLFIGSTFWYDRAGTSDYNPTFIVSAFQLDSGAAATQRDIGYNRVLPIAPLAANYIPLLLLTSGLSAYRGAAFPYQPGYIQPVVAYAMSALFASTLGAFQRGGGALAANETALMVNPQQTTYRGSASAYSVMYWPEQEAVSPGKSSTVTANGELAWPVAPSTYFTTKHLLIHQGSLVGVVMVPQFFGSTTRRHYRESIHYLPPYNMTAAADPGYLIPGERSSNGFGAVSSMNANELVLFRHEGGALVIRGDLGFPQIQQLPMVEGTFGVECVPVVTPLGVVYLSKNGVFAWNGGEGAQKLSLQIDGDLTDYTPTKPHMGSRGRLGWWSPWVLLPNNWMYDTRTNAWWRLDNTADHTVYNCYGVDANNRMYAFRYKTTVADNKAWDTYDQTTLASDWSWQSLPLIEQRDRWQSIAAVELVTERATGGTPTVVVTITGLNERGVQVDQNSVTFDLSANSVNGPASMIKLFPKTKGKTIQVQMVANSGSASVAAPLVKGLTIMRRSDKRTVSDLDQKSL